MHSKNPYSLVAIFFVWMALLLATFVYYPKWKESDREKVISWDVAGYYQYLPALFIHQDLKKVHYLEEAIAKYQFTPDNQQVLKLPNGNRVMKYAAGQALMFSPFFLAAHAYASNSETYLADGFSTPYQLALEIEIVFFAFLGLWFLRKILLTYFSDNITSIAIIGIALGTNYFEYASMTGAMTHNNLFALYALLIYATIMFYKRQSWWSAVCIGLCVGLAALTRPTELISVLIPLLWPLQHDERFNLSKRLTFFKNNYQKVVVAAIVAIAIGFIQLIYWKYVSGDWLVYSYGDEGFDWLSPHIRDCLISARAGWLIYSPMIGLAIQGFYALYKQNSALFIPCFTFTAIAMYVVFSWQTWWYGGSLGQRAMIQYYPLLAIPFTAFFKQIWNHRWIKILVFALCSLFIYHNFWVTHQVHWGGLIHVGHMNKAYLSKILWKYDVPKEYEKLLDSPDYLDHELNNSETIYMQDFESGDFPGCHLGAIEGRSAFCLSSLHKLSPGWSLEGKINNNATWLRLSADFLIDRQVWSPWAMGQMVIKFMKGDKLVKYNSIRYHRFLTPRNPKNIFMDVKIPEEPYDRAVVEFHNGMNNNMVILDNVRVMQMW